MPEKLAFQQERIVDFDENLASPLAQALARSVDGWALFTPEKNAQGEIVDFSCCFINPALQTYWQAGDFPAHWRLSMAVLPSLSAKIRQTRYSEVFLSGTDQSCDYPSEIDGRPRRFRETCQRSGGYIAVRIHDCSAEFPPPTIETWQADRQRLELVIAASNAGIWEFRLVEKGAVVILSRTGQTRYDTEEALDRFVERIHREDQQAVLRAISACLTGRCNHYQQEFRLLDMELGAYRWLLVSGQVVERDHVGIPVCMAGTYLDITEQHAVEERLQLAATVFDSNGEGIMITGPDLRILSVNRVFTTITGYSAEEAIGHKPDLLSSGLHEPDFYTEMWRAIVTDGHWQGEICNRRKDGSLYPEWLSISTVTSEQGQVTHYIGIFSDITERKRQQAHIEFLAFHDALTQLPNRQLLSDRFNVARALADRQNQKLALLFLDLDRFKLVNDTLGHQAGDQILVQTAHRLSEIVRESDTVCRLGGDEFVVLISGLRAPDEATDVAQAIITSVDRPFKAGEHEVRIAISVGIAIYPDDSRDFAELLKKSDTALYRAKQEGRHTYRFFTERMNALFIQRLLQENRLREGLELGELEIHYQPQLSLSDGQLVGIEALVRWRHPVEGLLLPGHFLPIAEESGLIVQLDACVLKTACLQMKKWLDMGVAPPRLSVNLSSMLIGSSNFIPILTSALHESGLPPERLQLELREDTLQSQAQVIFNALASLQGIGVEIAIDDFGTGYCNLAALRQLGIGTLKIARNFISRLEEEASESIVRGMLAMAQAMELNTLAEGVETRGQMEQLSRLGCDSIQGWQITHALPAHELTNWLQRFKNQGGINPERSP